ncbi:hypothetical protein QJS66_12300 [Kocuria rhizophila]|nr:hypothetical protein QJS66_12300 [Kocuria rhizophila]
MEVIDLGSVVPYDRRDHRRWSRAPHRARRGGGRVPGLASVASEIAARAQERCFHSLAAPVLRSRDSTSLPSPSFEHHHIPSSGASWTRSDDLPWRADRSASMCSTCRPGRGLAEADILRWLVAEGDAVTMDPSWRWRPPVRRGGAHPVRGCGPQAPRRGGRRRAGRPAADLHLRRRRVPGAPSAPGRTRTLPAPSTARELPRGGARRHHALGRAVQ